MAVVIPPRITGKEQRSYDKYLYQARNFMGALHLVWPCLTLLHLAGAMVALN
jgi:hypothetical protein